MQVYICNNRDRFLLYSCVNHNRIQESKRMLVEEKGPSVCIYICEILDGFMLIGNILYVGLSVFA